MKDILQFTHPNDNLNTKTVLSTKVGKTSACHTLIIK